MDEQPKTTLQPRPRWPIAVLVLGAAGAIAYLVAMPLLREEPAPAGPAPEVARGTPEAQPEEPAAPVDAPTAARLLEDVSPHPLYRRALAEGDFVERAALVIDNLAEGASPRRPLAYLAPSRPFTVVRRQGRTFVDPESYLRYDAFAAAVGSVDARAVAGAYRALRGALGAAYRALGQPTPLDAAVSRALRRIEAAPVREGDVEVVDEGGIYVFADARLERLREVEKHLLRMGPRNTRVLQAKAAELRQALGLPAPTERRADAP
jgi:hypothetical protein